MRSHLIAAFLFCAFSSFAGGIDLFTAASVGALASVEDALSSDFNVNSADSLGNTALLLAAENGHLNVVKYLIKAGADINRQNIFGYSPLFSAVINAHTEVVAELAANGADSKLSNIYGTSAEDYIAAFGYKDMNSYLSAIVSGGIKEKYGPNSFRYLAQNRALFADNITYPLPNNTSSSNTISPDNLTEPAIGSIPPQKDAQEQLKHFITDDTLDYLRKPHSREDVRTYLLSMGAFLESTGGSCDLYGLQGLVSSDYSLTRAKICFGTGKQQIVFEYLKDIDPLYKTRLERYISSEGYAMILSE